MTESTAAWIVRRTGRPATPTLVGLVHDLNAAGFGWFDAKAWRWEFERWVAEDRWEEVTVWVGLTRAGLVGFRNAVRAIRVIEDRSRSLDGVRDWLST